MTGPEVLAQVDAGREAFVQHCMMCHGSKLQGIGDAQKLVGQDFVDAWGRDTTKELFSAVRVEMPQNDPGLVADMLSTLNITSCLATCSPICPRASILNPRPSPPWARLPCTASGWLNRKSASVWPNISRCTT